MKHAIFVLCVCCLFGCSSMQYATDTSVPQLLIQYPLPPVPESMSQAEFHIDMILFVLEDGSVGKARLLKGIGDEAWDTLALATIKKWHFAPARMDNQPVSTWFRLKTTVQSASPVNMPLAEILCTNAEVADTVYEMLKQGKNFNDLAEKYSVSPSRDKKGMLGEVNINIYPENIRKILGRLMSDDFTRPVKYGDLYAIFKRFEK
jgi:TonB family protein